MPQRTVKDAGQLLWAAMGMLGFIASAQQRHESVPARVTASRAPMTPPAIAPAFGLEELPPEALSAEAVAVVYVGEPVRKPDTAPPAGVAEGIGWGVKRGVEGDEAVVEDGVAGAAESPSCTLVSVPSGPIWDTSVKTDLVLGRPAHNPMLLSAKILPSICTLPKLRDLSNEALHPCKVPHHLL